MLRTERLSLARPEHGDIDAILAVHSDPRAVAHNPGDALRTRDDAEALFARWDEHWRIYGFGYWVVRRLHAPPPLGFCGLKFMGLHGRRVLNLFYRLDPASWGDGVAAEAATAVVRWAADRFPDQPVIARVRPENVASQRVATHAGLVRAETLDGDGYDGLDWVYASG